MRQDLAPVKQEPVKQEEWVRLEQRVRDAEGAAAAWWARRPARCEAADARCGAGVLTFSMTFLMTGFMMLSYDGSSIPANIGKLTE